MELIYDPEARAELIQAIAYYEKSRPGLGHELLQAVEAGVAQIVHAPSRWPKIGRHVRRFLIPRFPFGIIYAVRETDIFIVAVAHLKRKPGYWQVRVSDDE